MLCGARAVQDHPLLRLFQNIENFPFLKTGDAKQMLVRKGIRPAWKAVGGKGLCPCH